MDRSKPVGNKCLESCMTVLDILENDGRIGPIGHFANWQSKLFPDLLMNLDCDCGGG